jgi:UPF0271 protein
MKLNCDLGESYGSWKMGLDGEAMPLIDMANVACGFHASDPDIMAATVLSAKSHSVTIGAHPGYHDKEGFGRRSIPHSPSQITNLVIYQTGALQAICQAHQVSVNYIKPHGALYNDMMSSITVYTAILKAASDCMPIPALMILAGPDSEQYIRLAEQYKVKLIFEAFADRAYTSDGRLAPRSMAGSVYHDSAQIIQQVQQISQFGSVTTIEGTTLSLSADTICVHGDNPKSIATLKQIKEELS